MPSMKLIKRRIASVSNTEQIVKAMNLVAASRLQRAKSLLNDIRPMHEHMKRLMDGAVGSDDLADNVFFEKREVKNTAYVIITSDRGLCGGYNLNVSKEAMALMEKNPGREKIISVGAKGWDYFRRRNKNIIHRLSGSSESAFYNDADAIGSTLISLYLAGEVDEVYLVYTQFETILTHTPKALKILPVGGGDGGERDMGMTYDPDLSTFMTYATPMYLTMMLYGALAEANVCEQASRMTSMDAATRNASEIIDDLTLDYNRKRQNIITQEITEIVSGANALN